MDVIAVTKMKTQKSLLAAFSLAIFLAAPAFAAGDGWGKLDAKEKDKVRRNYERWEKLQPQDKEHLREEWERWNRMPQDQRDRLKQRFNDDRRKRG